MASTSFYNDKSLRMQRYEALSQHDEYMGIDYIKADFQPIEDENWRPSLQIYFVAKIDAGFNVIPDLNILGSSNFQILDAVSEKIIDVEIEEPIEPTNNGVTNLVIVKFTPESLAALQELITGTLILKDVANIDPFFAQANFVATDDAITDIDCSAAIIVPAETNAKPEINYLAKDYASFRRLMLNRLSVLNPDWQLNNAADMGLTIVETLAHAADQSSYYQDAVATEAYLGTARQRISLKRHARLLDYVVHEGVNARVWVQVQVNILNDDAILLPSGTQFLTRVQGYEQIITPQNESTYQEILLQQPLVFETLYSISLYGQHNVLNFYNWGASAFSLSKGAISAAFVGSFNHLQVGDVLIFKELIDPNSGLELDAQQTHCHAVRLTKVSLAEDPIGGRFLVPPTFDPVAITQIEWHAEDALPFELIINAEINDEKRSNLSVALGNIVLADHGRSIEGESLLPSEVPAVGEYNPALQNHAVTFRMPFDASGAREKPAKTALIQDPHSAYPVDLTLQDDADITWLCKSDLLNSRPQDLYFVVEVNNSNKAFLRFGNDALGKRPFPGTHFQANYRVGNGATGNIGAQSLGHIVTNVPELTTAIVAITNPMPAEGGLDAESSEHVRLYAPRAFRKQQRCVTIADYVATARQHPEVQDAAAILQWTGSWNTFFIAVIRKNNLPVDEAFKQKLADYLKAYQLIGHDLQIIAPQYIPLDILLTVHTKKGHVATVVRKNLITYFSNRLLAEDKRGYFHPDNFNFGETVYLSDIVNQALQIPGVDYIDLAPGKIRFRTYGATNSAELNNGYIELRKLEVIQVSNEAYHPENGIIDFIMEN